MTHKQFDEFVEKQAKPGLSDAEKANAISEWTGDIVAFYELVDSFLQPYTVSGKILVGRKPKQMHEDLIGDYETQIYSILVGRSSLRLEPIGRYVIGARGRIDLIGPRNNIKFLKLDRSLSAPRVMVHVFKEGEKPPEPPVVKEWAWKIATNPPQIKYIDVTADTFFEAIMSVANV